MDVDSPIPFGKYGGIPISSVPSGYLRWVTDNIENNDELVETVATELEFRDRFDTHFEEYPND